MPFSILMPGILQHPFELLTWLRPGTVVLSQLSFPQGEEVKQCIISTLRHDLECEREKCVYVCIYIHVFIQKRYVVALCSCKSFQCNPRLFFFQTLNSAHFECLMSTVSMQHRILGVLSDGIQRLLAMLVNFGVWSDK